MLKQPVSLAMLELPLSRDLDLYHKLELHCSSLHHTKKCKLDQSNQVVVFKRNILPPKYQVETSFSSAVLSTMQDSILPTKISHMISYWRSTPKCSSYQWHCPIWIHITFQVDLLIRIILATIKWTCLNVFTTKQVSGLISVRYINEQIIWWYIVASTESDEATLNSFRFDAIGVVMQSIILNLFKISTAYFPCPHLHA